MIADLLKALPAALALTVIPGYFWAGLLCGRGGLAERLTYGAAFSLVLVPLAAYAILNLSGSSATLPVVLSAALAVTAGGALAYYLFGSGPEGRKPVSAAGVYGLPPAALLLLAAALLLALAAVLGAPGAVLLVPTALLVVVCGVLFTWGYVRSERRPEAGGGAPAKAAGGSSIKRALLPAILLAVLARGYAGPVLFDWPYIRGVDQYTQAIMTNLTLRTGSTESYMVYPQGFHLWVASVSRLSGVEPLEVFAVVAPALLVLPAMGFYALGRALWGWEYGVAAAAFGGLVLGSSYQYLSEARYPQLIAAQFLTALTVAAMFRLISAPSARAGVSFALLGSSVVFYHHVGSFFLALLLAAVGLTVLPYLLIRRRETGVALLGSYVLLGVLAVAFAWDAYDLGSAAATLLTGGEEGATGAAVSGVIGTQQPYDLAHIPETLSQPVVWLGLLGALLLIGGWRAASPADRASRFTLLLWAALMFAASRTELSGFPERFEMDLGVPLTLLAAFAAVEILRPAMRAFPAAVPVAAAALAVAALVGAQTVKNFAVDGGPAPGGGSTSRVAMTPEIQEVGQWLAEHNSGGHVAVSPYIESVPSRAMLAIGGYSGVQTFTPSRIERDRDLPPTGQQPPTDMLWILTHPADELTGRLIQRYDIRYIVIEKRPDSAHELYDEHPELYRKTFENEEAAIFAPRKEARNSPVEARTRGSKQNSPG